ncbi:MAG: ABC transporter permease, partial [Magnetospirillum sp.]
MSTETAAPPVLPAATGKRRDRTTRKSVVVKDKIADWTITIGGMTVILAVAGIMVFLLQVVVPLFTGGSVGTRSSYVLPHTSQRAVATLVDEYKVVATMLMADGKIVTFHAPTGKELQAPVFDFGGETATAFGSTLDHADVAFGFADGSVRFGELKMVARVIPVADIPAGLTKIDDRDSTDGRSIYRRLPGNQARVSSVEVTLEDPQNISDLGSAIVALDYRVSGGANAGVKSFVTVDASGVVRLTRAESKRNMLTGKSRTVVETSLLPSLPQGTQVERVTLTERADQVFAVSGNTIFRYDTRNFETPVLAETARVLPEGVKVTAFGFLIGEQSIVVGGSNGAVDVYFRLPRPNAPGSDGYELVRAHRLEPQSGAVVGLSASLRGKTFATLDERGNVWLRHSTSEQTLIRFDRKNEQPDTVALAPRANGILALKQGHAATLLDFDVPHPETTLATVFGKAWYEGYDGPTYTWQSSSGTDSFEPKFSLIPLIFGTIKATFYSLLFAVPIALLGAIYTSEFLDGSVRSVVKPAMEMMASLPSVVLGFIAALILAPIVETWIGALILAFVLVPLALVAGAYLWQLLPLDQANRLAGVPKLGFQFALVALTMFLAYSIAPQFETVFFGGDFKNWINGQSGNAAPFLFLVLLPVSFGAVAWTISRFYE